MSTPNPMKPLIDLYKVEQQIQRAKLEGNLRLALELYDRVIRIKQNLPNKLGYAKSVAEKAFLLEQNGFQQEALNTYHIASQIADNSPNKNFLGVIDESIKRLSSFQ